MTYTVRQTEIFAAWLADLTDRNAQKAIAKRLVRVEAGLLGDTASVGGGVSEMRFFVGPGYRVYFTIRQREIVILLCGGDKSSQSRDIRQAKELADDL
ncbi:type II toxin-antitoxin system RelE/ParE family toxin [Sphingomonas sanguinis]|uniref:type II toxin-antitoxin system RelE/ParE family toxin n=1 Tax=Sphingomonas sanguinis TaxID=33051 RepID=UPI001C57F744|nr:type II toxin-antitoxin system RelE/ParE family toxin [Sphingomonas sanguinis]QXT34318.1 type II toxin-antitoxin system RelE/ParE family toxin [Sphingomonas sanguinis]